MDMTAIGIKIKEARERAHLTQEDLSEIVDISPTHMSVIERGVKTPKLDTFVKIIKALNPVTGKSCKIVHKFDNHNNFCTL